MEKNFVSIPGTIPSELKDFLIEYAKQHERTASDIIEEMIHKIRFGQVNNVASFANGPGYEHGGEYVIDVSSKAPKFIIERMRRDKENEKQHKENTAHLEYIPGFTKHAQ